MKVSLHAFFVRTVRSSNVGCSTDSCVVDGKLEAYFRGRKLKGREVKVPGGDTGSICSQANKGSEAGEETTGGREGNGEELEVDKDEESGEEGEVRELEEVASFDEIVLWGHESLVEGDDPFVKGVEEWAGFAEAVSSCIDNFGLRVAENMLIGRV